MDLLSSKDVAIYLKKNDMVILPVGCFEMHGPRIPLACDALHDWAFSILLAERWKCLALPPVYYTYPGASGPWPGTVDISPEITAAYVKEIVRALFKNGFDRVVLVGSHGPLGSILPMVTGSLFQETGKMVLHVAAGGILGADPSIEKELGYPWGEDIRVLAALKLFGWEGAYDPRAGINRPQEFPFRTVGPLRRHGARAPWLFKADYQHTGIRPGVRPEHAGKAIELMARAIAKASRQPEGNLPKLFRRYQREATAVLRKKVWKGKGGWSM